MKIDILSIAKEVFEIESKEIKNLSKLLTDDFKKVIYILYKAKGKVIISGIGKSGIIGKKISSTLSSTGTPSLFLHPSEAYHGDLGVIEEQDVVILISNSGETDEVLRLIPFLKSQNNITIAISSNSQSTLGRNTDYHLNIKVNKEACPINIAPMSSATATLVMGDAIAVSLMKMKNFKNDNFLKFHPGGNLGKIILKTVKEVMKSDNLPICNVKDSIKNIIYEITDKKFGLIVVCENISIIGIITDGDIRRAMETKQNIFFDLKAEDLMHLNPKTINLNKKLIEAKKIMNIHKINSLLVTDNQNNFIGILQLYDLAPF